MVTIYELRGIEKGRRAGRVEGVIDAKRNTLIAQLEKKFGPLPADAKAAIEAIASAEKLDAMLLTVIDAKSIADVGL